MEVLFWSLAAAAALYIAWRVIKWIIEAVGGAPMNDG